MVYILINIYISIKNWISKIIYYNFNYSKLTLLKFLIIILISIFNFFLFFFYNNFLNHFDNYYITIDNFYLKTPIDFIISLDLINLNDDILKLFLILFIFYIIIIILFILSYWLKLFRLVLAFFCGKLITFYFNFTSNLLFNINSIINFAGLNISRKLSDIDKIEYFYQLKDQYMYNLETNQILDYILNSEKIKLYLSNFHDINSIQEISLLFNDILRSNTYYIQDSVDELYTNYILYIAGTLVIVLVSYLLYITISTIIQDNQNNALALENLNIKVDKISDNLVQDNQNNLSALENLNTNIDQVNMNTIDNLKEITEDMGTLEGKVDDLSLDVEAFGTRVDDVSKDLGTLENSFSMLKQMVESLIKS